MWTRCLRNEKVRGSSPLSSTSGERALTSTDVVPPSQSKSRIHSWPGPPNAPVSVCSLRRSRFLSVGAGSWLVPGRAANSSARRKLHVQVPERPQGQPEFGEVGGRAEVATADLLEPSQPVRKGVGVDVRAVAADPACRSSSSQVWTVRTRSLSCSRSYACAAPSTESTRERGYMTEAFGAATATELARPNFLALAAAFSVPACRNAGGVGGGARGVLAGGRTQRCRTAHAARDVRADAPDLSFSQASRYSPRRDRFVFCHIRSNSGESDLIGPDAPAA
jgi:hypothetical protein